MLLRRSWICTCSRTNWIEKWSPKWLQLNSLEMKRQTIHHEGLAFRIEIETLENSYGFSGTATRGNSHNHIRSVQTSKNSSTCHLISMKLISTPSITRFSCSCICNESSWKWSQYTLDQLIATDQYDAMFTQSTFWSTSYPHAHTLTWLKSISKKSRRFTLLVLILLALKQHMTPRDTKHASCSEWRKDSRGFVQSHSRHQRT